MEILKQTLFAPITSLKKRYIPLLLVYFAYGMQGLTAVTMTFWEKDTLSLSTEQFIVIGTWLTLPWTLKMVFGQLVDHQPILGSRRRSYVYLGASLMALGYLMLAGIMSQNPIMEVIGTEFTQYLAASLVTVFGFVIQDVTADTMSTEVIDRQGQSDQAIRQELAMIQVLGRLALMIGALIAAGLTGWLATRFSATPQLVALIALVLPAISIIGATLVRLDTKAPSQTHFSSVILGGGLIYTVFVMFMAFVGSIDLVVQNIPSLISWNQEIVFVVSLGLIITMLWHLLRDQAPKYISSIIWIFVALFIFRATPSTGPGFTWWAIDVLRFDQQFLGLLQFIGALVPLILLWFAAHFIAQAPVRWVLLGLVFIGTILSLPELGLYYGWHETLGLSPKLVMISDTALGSPLVHISMIPMLALIAYFAPESNRATWFAVMASLMNLAMTAGQLGTKYLNQIFVISREVLDEAGQILTPQNYTLLGDLMLTKVVISFALPMIVLLLVWNRIKL